MESFINFAHRGASGYCPENTMVAFHKAIELGANGIETDVQMCKDGHLVLIHDEGLQRTTGKQGFVKDFTLHEIQQLDAGSWYREEFRGERIPTLEELLQLAKDHGIYLNLELKNGIIQYPQLEERAAQLIRQFGLSEQVIISSFHHYSLVQMKRVAPEIATAVLYSEGLFEPWQYAKQIGASALHPIRYAVTKEWVEQATSAGVRYHPFTVNNEEEMKRMLSFGVSGIITDYPDKLAALL